MTIGVSHPVGGSIRRYTYTLSSRVNSLLARLQVKADMHRHCNDSYVCIL